MGKALGWTGACREPGLCDSRPHGLQEQGAGHAPWAFESLENQKLRTPFTSLDVAHGLGDLEGGIDDECHQERLHAPGCFGLRGQWQYSQGAEDPMGSNSCAKLFSSTVNLMSPLHPKRHVWPVSPPDTEGE